MGVGVVPVVAAADAAVSCRSPEVTVPFDIEAHDWEHFIRLHRADGWSVSLLTFMFDHMPGGRLAIEAQQRRLVEMAYRRLLTRMVRYPNRRGAVGRVPVLLGAPDFPVARRRKAALGDVVINDGQHVQALLLSPQENRLRTDECTFIEREQRRFVEHGGIRRLHAVPVLYDDARVHDYCMKAVGRGLVDPDATIILPRSLSEL